MDSSSWHMILPVEVVEASERTWPKMLSYLWRSSRHLAATLFNSSSEFESESDSAGSKRPTFKLSSILFATGIVAGLRALAVLEPTLVDSIVEMGLLRLVDSLLFVFLSPGNKRSCRRNFVRVSDLSEIRLSRRQFIASFEMFATRLGRYAISPGPYLICQGSWVSCGGPSEMESATHYTPHPQPIKNIVPSCTCLDQPRSLEKRHDESLTKKEN